jgi:DNA-binding IclR family transcriptional regulator
VRLRDIAASLGITERSAHGIVTDLAAAGYVVKQRDGRRNRYQIQATSRCQNPLAGAALSARCWTLATMDPRPLHSSMRPRTRVLVTHGVRRGKKRGRTSPPFGAVGR